MIELEQITQQAQTAISEASELSVLDALRVEYTQLHAPWNVFKHSLPALVTA